MGGEFTNVAGDQNIVIDARTTSNILIQVQNNVRQIHFTSDQPVLTRMMACQADARAHHQPEHGGFQVSSLASMLAVCRLTTGLAGAAPIPNLKAAFGAVASILEASAVSYSTHGSYISLNFRRL